MGWVRALMGVLLGGAALVTVARRAEARDRTPQDDANDKRRIGLLHAAIDNLDKNPGLFDGTRIPAGADLDKLDLFIQSSTHPISDFRYNWPQLTPLAQTWPEPLAMKAKFDQLVPYFEAALVEYKKARLNRQAESDRLAKENRDKADKANRAAQAERNRNTPGFASRVPPAPWYGSGEGSAMGVAANEVTRQLDGCPVDNTDAKRAAVRAYAAKVAAIQDPGVRDAFTEHVTQLQTWIETFVVGAPGGGSWAELNAEYKAGAAAAAALPTSLDREVVNAAYDKFAAAAKHADLFNKMALAVERDSPCPKRPGEWTQIAWQLAKAKTTAKDILEGKVVTVERTMEDWRSRKGNLPATPPETFWAHAEWLKNQLEAFKRTQTTAAAVALLERGASVDPKVAAAAAAARTEIDAALTVGQTLANELARVGVPPLKKDSKAHKMVQAALSDAIAGGGKLLGQTMRVPGSSVEKWTEDVTVRQVGDKIWYKVVKFEREFYTTYYYWQPSAAAMTAPDLPGLPAAQICEVWVQNFSRYKKGKPDSKNWYPSASWLTHYIPCANIGKASTLKLEKN